MAWFKVDDGLHASKKLLRIPRQHRLAALGLWTIAGSWSANQLTDGHVPDYMVDEWGGTQELVDWLVRSELWSLAEDGAQFNNWAEYQPTKAEVEDERRRNREKLQKWRESKRRAQEQREPGPEQDPVTGGVTSYNTVTNQNVTAPQRNVSPDPTRPDPTPSSNEEGKGGGVHVPLTDHPDVEALCQAVHEALARNGFKPPRTSAASRRDAHGILQDTTLEKALNVLAFGTTDKFWRTNIKSMAKFREHYPALRLQALEAWEKNRSRGNVTAHPDGDINPDDVLGKDYWSCPNPPQGLSIEDEMVWKREQRRRHDEERLAEARLRLENRGNPAA